LFAKFARFLVEPHDENPMTSICHLHGCTEVLACTRYIVRIEGEPTDYITAMSIVAWDGEGAARTGRAVMSGSHALLWHQRSACMGWSPPVYSHRQVVQHFSIFSYDKAFNPVDSVILFFQGCHRLVVCHRS
jgi:hypothetical protein